MNVGFLKDNRAIETIRARVAFHSRQHGFDRCMQRIVEGTQLPVPSSLLADLFAYWGDPLGPRDESYLRSCLAEVTATDGAILQCGAGLSTLVLGALCHRSEIKTRQLWCLENDRHWANTMRSWLTEYRVTNTHVIHSRAQMFDNHAWYAVDTARLAKHYSLVLCEGARASPKGALGALCRLGDRLGRDFVLLARDVSHPADLKELKRWADANAAKIVLVDRQEGFVKISRQTAAQNPDDASPQNPRMKRAY